MYLDYGGRSFATLDTQKDSVLGGFRCLGGHGIKVEMSVRLQGRPAEESIEVIHLWATLHAQQALVTQLAPMENSGLGTCTSENTSRIRLGASLDVRQMAALDDYADPDGTRRLQLQVGGIAQGPHGPLSFWDMDGLSVGVEAWQAVISASGYGATMLCELVVPHDTGDPGMVKAVKGLEKAIRLARRPSDSADAVAACRVALEEAGIKDGLPGGMKMDWGCDGDRKRTKDDATVRERMGLLRWATRLVAHLPHHTGDAEYTREQAKLITRVSAALLAYEAEVLDAH